MCLPPNDFTLVTYDDPPWATILGGLEKSHRLQWSALLVFRGLKFELTSASLISPLYNVPAFTAFTALHCLKANANNNDEALVLLKLHKHLSRRTPLSFHVLTSHIAQRLPIRCFCIMAA
jgi:hypothetical protein